ncbi:hypothetical protein GCM10009555_073970 [Acrocarpospora macrocephala]|uniref:Uncharacterized protein n=1 Tax=Acrocarpospora macrocephala TaxID=150177 RepID=A0A5M3WQ92_9ACTN|nr:hypothetical protein Amac_050420 [Acrocarpospora macrocephala]
MDPPPQPPNIDPPTRAGITMPPPQDTRKAAIPGAPNAQQRADLAAIARRLASRHKEENPANIRYIASTRQEALAETTASRVSGDASVYVIQMEGNFLRHTRHGLKPIVGNSITIIVDAETGQVTDWSMSPRSHDLSRLGQAAAL